MAMKLPPFGTRVMYSKAAAVSRTLRVSTPSTLMRWMYSLCTNGRGTRPRDALRPTRPQNEAGMRVEPPPSDDMLIGVIPAATAAAEPPDEPPGVRARFHGLRVTLTIPR